MSDTQLDIEAIKAVIDQSDMSSTWLSARAKQLIAEVERLRKENARLTAALDAAGAEK